MDYDTLAEKVGRPPRIARRIIEGKVAVYFEALGHRPEPQDIDAYRLEQETL